MRFPSIRFEAHTDGRCCRAGKWQEKNGKKIAVAVLFNPLRALRVVQRWKRGISSYAWSLEKIIALLD
jgi:hypothetical protein